MICKAQNTKKKMNKNLAFLLNIKIIKTTTLNKQELRKRHRRKEKGKALMPFFYHPIRQTSILCFVYEVDTVVYLKSNTKVISLDQKEEKESWNRNHS